MGGHEEAPAWPHAERVRDGAPITAVRVHAEWDVVLVGEVPQRPEVLVVKVLSALARLHKEGLEPGLEAAIAFFQGALDVLGGQHGAADESIGVRLHRLPNGEIGRLAHLGGQPWLRLVGVLAKLRVEQLPLDPKGVHVLEPGVHVVVALESIVRAREAPADRLLWPVRGHHGDLALALREEGRREIFQVIRHVGELVRWCVVGVHVNEPHRSTLLPPQAGCLTICRASAVSNQRSALVSCRARACPPRPRPRSIQGRRRPEARSPL